MAYFSYFDGLDQFLTILYLLWCFKSRYFEKGRLIRVGFYVRMQYFCRSFTQIQTIVKTLEFGDKPCGVPVFVRFEVLYLF